MQTEYKIGTTGRVMVALTILIELYLQVSYLIRWWASMSASQHEASGGLIFCIILLGLPFCYNGKRPLTNDTVSPTVIALMGFLMALQLFRH